MPLPAGRVRPAAVLVGLALTMGVAAGASGQEPRRPDLPTVDSTGVADSSATAADSTTAAGDTLKPVLVVPRFRRGGSPSWTSGIWEWDRSAILASGAVTLTDLLEHIPGVQSFRFGMYGHPEIVNPWGMTAGRLEIVLDGFVLDPLDAGVQDLSRIELAALERVRVERAAGRFRVELETVAPTDPRPYSLVEAGTGEPDNAKLFRGVFQTPRFLGGPFSLGVERVDSDGFNRNEPANTFAGWGKWAIVSGRGALQLEARRAGVERTLSDGAVVDGSRQDVVLRARAAPQERITTEAYFGISKIDDGLGSSFGAGEAGPDSAAARARVSSAQGGVRAAFQGERVWSRASARVRSQPGLPLLEAELAGGLRVLGPLHVGGTLTWSDWRDGATAHAYSARAELGPILGVRPFAEVSGGLRGVPFLLDARDAPVLTERTTLRLGGQLQYGGFRLGGALLELSEDSVPGYLLPFDRNAELFPGGTVRGWEIVGRLPLFWGPLSIEGWHSRWLEGAPWVYMPKETWRAALVYSHSPLPSGNLEILGRLEARHRGATAVPQADGGTTQLAPYTSLDAYLQIRVLSVRAYVRWENLTRRIDIQDFPERAFPQQRVFYGVKWQFWN